MADKTHETKQSNQAVNKQRAIAPVEHAAESIAIGAPGVEYTLADPYLASPAQLLALQRMTGNRAVSRLIQTKLTVGPARDRYEQEADRMAEQVVSGQWSVDRHPPTVARPVQRQEEEEEVQTKPLVASITPLVQRQAAPEEEEVQTKPIVQHAAEEEEEVQTKRLVQREAAPEEEEVQTQRMSAADSFDAGSDFESRLSATRGGGSPLPDAVRGQMEAGFGADFSGVRVHTGDEAAQLNRAVSAQAFTHGTDIYLGAGKSDLGSNEGQKLLAHELTHVLQQTGSSLSSSSPAAQLRVALRHSAVNRMIQRHSTHEHYLLGTFKPEDLASLPEIREQIAQAKAGTGVVDEKKRADAIHLIEQEMRRLVDWQHKGPAKQLAEQKTKFGAEIGVVKKVSGEWQVPYVEIPTDNGSVICTYGELNTLADMFGTIEDLQNTRGEIIIRMLQGVRQRVYIKLYEIYEEIGGPQAHKMPGAGKATEMEAKWLRPGTTFEGALGFTGKEKTPIGRAMAVKGYEYSTKEGGSMAKYPVPGGQREFTEANASAALARNACHFAPECWYTWRRYHDQARLKATQANALFRRAAANRRAAQLLAPLPQAPGGGMRAAPTEQSQAKEAQRSKLLSDAGEWEEQAKGLANEALLFSGFGDHYLQDSYAAGHLIDKTKIMQWYVDWLQSTGKAKQTADWAMIRAVVEQNLTSNPQMMENVRGDLGAKLQEVGINVVAPESQHILVLMWWRKKASGGKDKAARTVNAGEVMNAQDLPAAVRTANNAWNSLQKLVDLGFAKKETTKQGYPVFVLNQETVNVVQAKGSSAYKSQMKDQDLQKQAQEFYYVGMTKFMDNTYVQKMTNYLHDKFCKEGLPVQSGYDEDLGKIYGDAAMLTAGGQRGILHSVTTAHWARDAIMDLIQNGATPRSTADIEKRFPAKVIVAGTAISHANWMAGLEAQCKNRGGLFEKGSGEAIPNLLKVVAPSLTGQKAFSPIKKVLEQAARPENQVPHAIF